MNDLKIIGLKMDGFQKLSAVEMEFSPEGGCVFIRGGNEQGKTSIIESLWWLFSGKTIINPEKIQHGKEKIIGMVDLGEFTIRRVQTEKSDQLEIKKNDGFSVVEKKEAFLKRLTNDLTFNPFPFLNLPAEKKLKFMMDFLKIDFTDIDLEIENYEQERLYIGREIKAIGEIENLPEVKLIHIGDLLDEKNRIQEQIEMELDEIREYNQEQNNRNYTRKNIKTNIKILEREIEGIKCDLKIAMEKLSNFVEELKSIPDPEPIKAEIASQNTLSLDLEILNAEQVNLKHEEWKRNEEKRILKKDKECTCQTLNQKIKSLRKAKKEKLSKANTGVPGLEIRENGLFYNNIFLENCSDSEKLKISMKLCHAMKPPLKAVFLDHGESFDKVRIEEIKNFAKDHDIQVFITQVADDIPEEIPSNIFYIVEGEVKK